MASPGAGPISGTLGKVLRSLLPETPLGDRIYSTARFLRHHRRLPRFRGPQTFNDHLFRLKHGGALDEPLRHYTSDKEQVKSYVEEVIGSDYVLPTLGLLSGDLEVERYRVSRAPCIVKPTHLSGHVMIVRDPDRDLDRAEMKRWLRLDHYRLCREANYRGLQRRILVEEFFSEDGTTPADDYKVFCFAGEPKMIQVDRGRFGNHFRRFFSPRWQALPFSYIHPSRGEFPRPDFLDALLALSRRLAAPFSFIRVDFLVARGEMKVGELTSCPQSALGAFRPASFDRRLGRLFSDPDWEVERILA